MKKIILFLLVVFFFSACKTRNRTLSDEIPADVAKERDQFFSTMLNVRTNVESLFAISGINPSDVYAYELDTGVYLLLKKTHEIDEKEKKLEYFHKHKVLKKNQLVNLLKEKAIEGGKDFSFYLDKEIKGIENLYSSDEEEKRNLIFQEREADMAALKEKMEAKFDKSDENLNKAASLIQKNWRIKKNESKNKKELTKEELLTKSEELFKNLNKVTKDNASYKTDEKSRKKAILIYPDYDHNGAFNLMSTKAFYAYLTEEHSIFFERVSSVDHFIRVLQQIQETDKRPIDHLTLSGHGNDEGITWGGMDKRLTIHNIDLIADLLNNHLAPHATILVIGCSTGNITDKKNFVETLAETFPGKRVIGPTLNTSQENGDYTPYYRGFYTRTYKGVTTSVSNILKYPSSFFDEKRSLKNMMVEKAKEKGFWDTENNNLKRSNFHLGVHSEETTERGAFPSQLISEMNLNSNLSNNRDFYDYLNFLSPLDYQKKKIAFCPSKIHERYYFNTISKSWVQANTCYEVENFYLPFLFEYNFLYPTFFRKKLIDCQHLYVQMKLKEEIPSSTKKVYLWETDKIEGIEKTLSINESFLSSLHEESWPKRLPIFYMMNLLFKKLKKDNENLSQEIYSKLEKVIKDSAEELRDMREFMKNLEEVLDRFKKESSEAFQINIDRYEEEITEEQMRTLLNKLQKSYREPKQMTPVERVLECVESSFY